MSLHDDWAVFKRTNGKPIYINPQHVVAVTPALQDENQSLIYVTGAQSAEGLFMVEGDVNYVVAELRRS